MDIYLPRAPSADPVVRATAETTTPDLAAIAALDAALAAYGIGAAVLKEGYHDDAAFAHAYLAPTADRVG